jgi:hypothetical protein
VGESESSGVQPLGVDRRCGTSASAEVACQEAEDYINNTLSDRFALDRLKPESYKKHSASLAQFDNDKSVRLLTNKGLATEDVEAGSQLMQRIANLRGQLELVAEVCEFVKDSSGPITDETTYIQSHQAALILGTSLSTRGVEVNVNALGHIGLERVCKMAAAQTADAFEWRAFLPSLSVVECDGSQSFSGFTVYNFSEDARPDLQKTMFMTILKKLLMDKDCDERFRIFVQAVAEWTAEQSGNIVCGAIANFFGEDGDMVVLADNGGFDNDVVSKVSTSLRDPLHVLHDACIEAVRKIFGILLRPRLYNYTILVCHYLFNVQLL